MLVYVKAPCRIRVPSQSFTMGKDKKSLDELKKEIKTIDKKDQEKVRGGSSDKEKDKEKNKWNSGLGGIVPQ